MRRLLIVLGIALLAGAALFQLFSGFRGFVLISIGHYVIQTGLWTALLIVVLAVLVLWLVRRFYRLIFLPRRWLDDRSLNRQRKHRDRTVQGLLDYLEGNWPAAVKHFTGAVRHSGMAIVNYLGAASASFNAGDQAGAVEWLSRAERSGAADELATGLLKTRLYLLQRDFDEALSLVRELHGREPDHPTVLRLLASVYKARCDWSGIEALLPDIRRSGALSDKELDELEKEVYRELIAAFPIEGNASRTDLQSDLDQLWDRVPRRLQKDSALIACYVRQLQGIGAGDKAEARLRRHLGKNPDNGLFELYGTLDSDPAGQLRAAESWTDKQPDNPVLLRTLGDLSCRNHLWGKAREYFQKSLSLRREPATYYRLGELLEQLGDDEAATDCFREGLALVAAPMRPGSRGGDSGLDALAHRN